MIKKNEKIALRKRGSDVFEHSLQRGAIFLMNFYAVVDGVDLFLACPKNSRRNLLPDLFFDLLGKAKLDLTLT